MVICFVSFCSNFVYLYIIELVILLFWIPFCMPFVVFFFFFFCSLLVFSQCECLCNFYNFVSFDLSSNFACSFSFSDHYAYANWFPTFCSLFVLFVVTVFVILSVTWFVLEVVIFIVTLSVCCCFVVALWSFCIYLQSVFVVVWVIF